MHEPTITPIGEHWDRLLAPISTAKPSGESLRYAGIYDEIREARRQDDADLPQGEWQRAVKRAEWPLVEELCLAALEHRSKDLQIAVWLLEAALHLYGYAGVRDGLNLLYALCEQFWDTLWPEWEDSDPDLRLSPFVWLNEKLETPLRLEVEMTAPTDPGVAAYTYFDLQQALKREADPERENKAGQPSHARFLHSAALTPGGFYARLAAELRDSLDTTAQLNRLLDEKCGRAAPSFQRLLDTLSQIHQAVDKLLQEHAPALEDRHGEDSAMAQEQASAEGAESSGPIRSRAEAYRRLNEAAEYLLRTEPHSPAPYLVKRAVSWGRLPLGELLQELVNDNSDLQAIYTLLGMNKRGQE